ncbi:FUSC family protein [Thiotrichales bacterium 19X7-9]|nr:FUSC family protein [Thiotrichales bacterium 19X7-9]
MVCVEHTTASMVYLVSLNLNIHQTHKKLLNRISGALIGLPLGIITFITIELLFSKHDNLMQLIHYLSFMGIILSLRAFKHYIHGFAARCFFVCIFASDYFISISFSRLSDVLIGGVIGYLTSISLNRLQLLQKHIQ